MSSVSSLPVESDKGFGKGGWQRQKNSTNWHLGLWFLVEKFIVASTNIIQYALNKLNILWGFTSAMFFEMQKTKHAVRSEPKKIFNPCPPVCLVFFCLPMLSEHFNNEINWKKKGISILQKNVG